MSQPSSGKGEADSKDAVQSEEKELNAAELGKITGGTGEPPPPPPPGGGDDTGMGAEGPP